MNIVQVRFLEPLFIHELSLFSGSPPSLKPPFPKIPISLGQAGNEYIWLQVYFCEILQRNQSLNKEKKVSTRNQNRKNCMAGR